MHVSELLFHTFWGLFQLLYYKLIYMISIEFCKHWLARYVSSVIPPGSEELRGNEAETIIKFKDALGIDDPDAASMHMEVSFHYLCPYAEQIH